MDGSGWVCGDDGKLIEDEVEDYIENDVISLVDGSKIGGVVVFKRGKMTNLVIGSDGVGEDMIG